MASIQHDVQHLGQVFTPDPIVDCMLSLRENGGRLLEPSCGDGAFLKKIAQNDTKSDGDYIGIEIDPFALRSSSCAASVLRMDFFAYPTTEQFPTIIGNPPYVKYRDIPATTRAALDLTGFDRRSNLYIFFIEKCMRHLPIGGELIFITPRDFIKATSARHLNERLYAEGSFTHFEDMGDARIFSGFSPNCAIWRWVKGRQDKVLYDGRLFRCHKGQLWFGKSGGTLLGDYFEVKVGAVSGADPIYTHPEGNTAFVYSKTNQTGDTKRMIYNTPHPHLERHKSILLGRRIRQFTEQNWWQWGRLHHQSPSDRLYVNTKTRNKRPFFSHDARAFDGSILGLFPRQAVKLSDWVGVLNDQPWKERGFVCDGRFLFSQRSLENAVLE